jgi:hypothetical protein
MHVAHVASDTLLAAVSGAAELEHTHMLAFMKVQTCMHTCCIQV